MQAATVEDAQPQLHELVQAALNGEEVLISAEDQRQVRLEPVPKAEPKPKGKRQLGRSKGLIIYMADDFDAPLEDFKDYM